MTMLSIAVNAPAPADSFAIADSLVTRYLAEERRPMWDAPLDTVRVVADAFVAFPQFTGVGAAVRVGGRWVLIETGQAAGAAARAAAWLERATPGARVAAGIVASPTPGNGGVRWFAEQRLPLFVAPGARRNVSQMLGPSTAAARATAVNASRWVRIGADSLWLEVLDLPDTPGALAIYSPTHRWLFGNAVVGRPAVQRELEVLIARLAARGLPVEWVGNSRAVRNAVKG